MTLIPVILSCGAASRLWPVSRESPPKPFINTLYAQFKKSSHPTRKLHRTVHRPWGTSTALEEGPHFKIKRIVVKPRASLSLQMHHHRSERWILISGTVSVVRGDPECLVPSNESSFIPASTKHHTINPRLVERLPIAITTRGHHGGDHTVRVVDKHSPMNPAQLSTSGRVSVDPSDQTARARQ